MAISQQNVQGRHAWRERLSTSAAQLSITLAGGRARLAVLLLTAVFCVWQLYVFAWVPLSRQTALPEGLTSVSAELDVAALTKIRDARAVRLQHRPNLFSNADQYFTVSPPKAVP